MNNKDNQALQNYINITKQEVENSLNNLDIEAIDKAAEIIKNAKKNKNRIHVSGIGKPGHIAGYIASLMSSTGTPTYFLHGVPVLLIKLAI